MKCWGVDKVGDSETVQLSAVTSGSEENKQFAVLTPTATFNITIDNPNAQGMFEPGKEYFLEVYAAEPAQAEPTPAATAG